MDVLTKLFFQQSVALIVHVDKKDKALSAHLKASA